MCAVVHVIWWQVESARCFFFASRRRHTRCALVTGVQTCALPISDWLADHAGKGTRIGYDPWLHTRQWVEEATQALAESGATLEIGRASCRERVCQYV